MKAIFFEENGGKFSDVMHMPRNLMALMRYALSCLLLSAASARAEAPPSQEFWNYFVEFGDTQGEIFDPTDYAEVANIPVKAQQKIDTVQSSKNAVQSTKSEEVTAKSSAAQELSQ